MFKSIDKIRSLAAKRGWATRRANEVKLKKKVPTKTKVKTSASTKISTASLKKPMITKWHSEGNLNQIYSSGLEFAFISKEGEQCHPFAFCKDYLQDAIWATLNKSSAAIYGFSYKHGRNPIVDLKKTRMALRFKNQAGFDELAVAALKFIHEMEKAQGYELSELHYGGKYKDKTHPVYVFVSDQRWMHSPVMISLYTLALRVGLSYTGGDWQQHFTAAKKYYGRNDKTYTKAAKKALEKIIGKDVGDVFAKKFADNYPKKLSMSGMHDRSGIVSFGNGYVDAQVKVNWKK